MELRPSLINREGFTVATYLGKKYNKRELLRYIGDMSQIAGVRPVELVNGNERGVRALEFKTGSGFNFTVLADRGLDVYDAAFNGLPLAWHSPAGAVAPAYYDRHDNGWLWSFAGGLVVTCGLTQAGATDIDEEMDEELGLHGRVSNIPARNVSFGADWEDDEYLLWATGEIREARLFGPNLVMRRSLYTRLGESRLWIKDVIENEGFEPAPLMLLYHCNIGFPVVSENSELVAVVNTMEPRDEDAEKGADRFEQFEEPTPGYAEQCFFIDHDADEKGMINVALVNRAFDNNHGLGVYLSYPKDELPLYTEWKMMGEQAYVVGMEPGNCHPEGRRSARERGVLKMLEPGESQTFHLEIGVLPGNQEIRSFELKLRGNGQ
jgi:hypothetical protein